MQECCTCGSVRGALGNQRPYRDKAKAGISARRQDVVRDSCGCMAKERRCRCENADVYEFDGVRGDWREGQEAVESGRAQKEGTRRG
jgi:hypothetical protein